MPLRKGKRRWVPVPIPWEGVSFSEDGRRLFVAHVTGDAQPADRADIRWEQELLTLTLSRMREAAGGKLAAVHCVEVPVSHDASTRTLVDGATGERASAKRSPYLAPEVLTDAARTLESVFEPRELLTPREITWTIPPRTETEPWVRSPVDWEGVRSSDDGRRVFVVYITGDPPPADRADVRWDHKRLTLTLSRMFEGDLENAAAITHCVEVPLSKDASERILIDGATGERARAKKSSYLDPEFLRGTGRTLDEVFEPRELLEPREITV